MLEWSYSLSFQSPVSIHSGLAVAGLVDRMVMRKPGGLPYIPGSSVKGRWRFFAERLLFSLGRMERQTDEPWIHPPEQTGCKIAELETACTLCRWFGKDGIPASLWVGDAELAPPLRDLVSALLEKNPNPVVHPDVELRPGIALDRRRRTTLEDHLFFDEAVPQETIFIGTILLRKEPILAEKQFLLGAAKLVDCLGGRKAVGRGCLEGGIRVQEGRS